MIRIDCKNLSTEKLGESPEIRDAYDCFTRHGYALLDHVISERAIDALHREFHDRYASYIADREPEDSLQVGNRRFMIPLRLSGSLGAPLVFANPYVVALVRKLLGADAILEAFGAIISLSGSQAQHAHPDGPPLFGAEISALLPPHALTFALPLIEMNETSGTTDIWPGSHRWRANVEGAPFERPVVPAGSCLLWDFRTFHSGTPNKSQRPRPMIYGTYARRWYQDPVNFIKVSQQRLVFEPEFLDSVPADMQALFAHVRVAMLPGELSP